MNAQSITIEGNNEAHYLWRVDPQDFPIEDSHIFPQVTLSTGANLANLGRAWLSWDINTSGGIIGAYGIFDKGELLFVNSLANPYSDIIWFGLEDVLLAIGVGANQTDLYYIVDGDTRIIRSIPGNTQDHHFIITSDSFFVYAYNSDQDQSFYYSLQDFNIRITPTEERVIAGGIGGAIIEQQNTNRVLYTGNPNITLPSSLSDNLRTGHFQLTPTIYDLGNQAMWLSNGSSIPFPELINKIGFYGVQSSLLIGDGVIFERTPTQFTTIANLSSTPFDYAIIDIGLYIGPVKKAGLGFVSSGPDTDDDGLPNTMEDYYGTLPTVSDTDGDGLSDAEEVRTDINPLLVDATRDYDNDGLSNIEEITRDLDPHNRDSDYGGALDGWEIKYGYNASDRTDDQLDDDNDGVTNAQESIWGSHPRKSDTDGDGIPDRWEIEHGIDPTIDNANADPDQDGLTNYDEYLKNSDPLLPNPKSLYDGILVELGIIGLMVLPISVLMWRSYFVVEE